MTFNIRWVHQQVQRWRLIVHPFVLERQRRLGFSTRLFRRNNRSLQRVLNQTTRLCCRNRRSTHLRHRRRFIVWLVIITINVSKDVGIVAIDQNFGLIVPLRHLHAHLWHRLTHHWRLNRMRRCNRRLRDERTRTTPRNQCRFNPHAVCRANDRRLLLLDRRLDVTVTDHIRNTGANTIIVRRLCTNHHRRLGFD